MGVEVFSFSFSFSKRDSKIKSYPTFFGYKKGSHLFHEHPMLENSPPSTTSSLYFPFGLNDLHCGRWIHGQDLIKESGTRSRTTSFPSSLSLGCLNFNWRINKFYLEEIGYHFPVFLLFVPLFPMMPIAIDHRIGERWPHHHRP